MQLADTEKLLAQCDIIVHIIHIVVNGGNKVMVNLNRYLVVRKGILQTCCVFSCFCIEIYRLYLCVKRRCTGVLEAVVGRIHRLERIFSERPVTALNKRDIGRMCYLVLYAVLVGSVGKFQVCIGEHREDVFGRITHFRCQRYQLFLGRRKDMLLFAADKLQLPSVKLQLGLLCKHFFKLLFVNAYQLRSFKAPRRINQHKHVHSLSRHILIF